MVPDGGNWGGCRGAPGADMETGSGVSGVAIDEIGLVPTVGNESGDKKVSNKDDISETFEEEGRSLARQCGGVQTIGGGGA